MNYEETIEFLYHSAPLFQNIGAGAYKEGLSTTEILDAHFGHPHRAYRIIHVAGTNGKGSTSHTLAAILQSAGFRVGLYTSPHLVDFRERIRVDGVPIEKERVVAFVEEERRVFEPLHPSFFELTTALALKYFEEQRVDVAVIEVGLGGRLDCTNIVCPALSVITNISLDHTQLLGDTLEQIAREKAGIIKPGVPVVVGEVVPATRPVFEGRAAELGAPLFFAQEEACLLSAATTSGGEMDYETRDWGNFCGQLGGACQRKNAATVLSAVAHLPISLRERIDRAAVVRGFAEVCELTGLRGRWQVVERAPMVVCDTGHNVDAWRYLSRQLAALRAERLHMVVGVCGDKDVGEILRCFPADGVYYFTQASVMRALPAAELCAVAGRLGLRGEAHATVGEAYAAARAAAGRDDVVFVGGSSFVVADFLMERGD